MVSAASVILSPLWSSGRVRVHPPRPRLRTSGDIHFSPRQPFLSGPVELLHVKRDVARFQTSGRLGIVSPASFLSVYATHFCVGFLTTPCSVPPFAVLFTHGPPRRSLFVPRTCLFPNRPDEFIPSVESNFGLLLTHLAGLQYSKWQGVFFGLVVCQISVQAFSWPSFGAVSPPPTVSTLCLF